MLSHCSVNILHISLILSASNMNTESTVMTIEQARAEGGAEGA